MTQTTSDTAVIHLVRFGNDPEALERFITSYQRFPAGAPHRLIFLLKGFGPELPPSMNELMNIVPHSKLSCLDGGFDVGSYFFAAHRISEPVLMFSNSFSVLQSDDWLRKLLDAYSRPGVGLVGVTGSWESLSTQAFTRGLQLPQSQFLKALIRVKGLATGLALLPLFPQFPNVHVRTNGFLLGRTEFLSMRPRVFSTKLDAWRFESGRNSMTCQVLKRGLKVLIVGRNGTVYQPEQWHESKTFWQSNQENLLIHDNRTLAYQQGSSALRMAWSKAAWNIHDSA